MTVYAISADFESQLHKIAEDNGGAGRKAKIARLEALNELAEPILDDLNSDNLEYVEIEKDLATLNEEIEQFNQQMDTVLAEQESENAKAETRNARINELAPKEQDGSITDAEKDELAILRYQESLANQNSNDYNSKISQLNSSISASTAQITADYDTLGEISDAMEGYAEAGETIQNKAMEFGRQNMNCEQIMQRNESSWWSQAGKWAGTVAAVSGITMGTLGVAEVAGLWSLTAYVGYGSGAAGLAGLITGFGSTGKQMQNYLDSVGYETLDLHSTYYDTTDNEYVSEYQALEAKGGNQVQGKVRQLQCKAYSFGKTINFAAGHLKTKADNLASTNTTSTTNA